MNQRIDELRRDYLAYVNAWRQVSHERDCLAEIVQEAIANFRVASSDARLASQHADEARNRHFYAGRHDGLEQALFHLERGWNAESTWARPEPKED